jgi:plastocyanin
MASIGLTNIWPGASRAGIAAAMLACSAAVAPTWAQDAVEISISVKDHKFDPAELQAPAGKPITLRVKNLDPTPIEFESKSLRVEKVLTGNAEAVVNIRPQKPGRYEFFDEFHEKTTRGVLVVK